MRLVRCTEAAVQSLIFMPVNGLTFSASVHKFVKKKKGEFLHSVGTVFVKDKIK